MYLASFLNKLIKEDGFILVDANNNKYVIGIPIKENPIILKHLDKALHYKLLFYPDLYFGEAYTDGSIKIENGTLTDFLNIALKNIGRSETNKFSQLINSLRGSYSFILNFNFVKPLISINSIFSVFLAIDFNGFSKKFSKPSPTQNIRLASCSIFACDGFRANPCGEAYPSTIKSGLPTPSIR